MSFLGAAYRKSDFQIHSPRDRAWDGARPTDGLPERTRDAIASARISWGRDFIRECVGRGLQAVAITDHHEGVYIWNLLTALSEARAEGTDLDLWIFPAMELTAKDSAQAIVVFDADLSPALFAKARNLLRLPVDCRDDEDQGIEVELLDFNIVELDQILGNDAELKNRYIILPNVTPGGHKTVLRRGFHKRFKELPYVGGYLDRKKPADLDDGDRRILEGEIPAWTSERRGIISTSDSRYADFRLLGEHATWIKLAEPTAESIRQAMLAADSRIAYAEPNPPAVFVHSVQVEGAEFLEVEETILSPQYNAVIGGRGAGKSTLLEFIRFGLGRSAVDGASEWDPTQERRKTILEQALKADTGMVRLIVHMDRAPVKLTRSRALPDRIEMEVGGETRVLSPQDIRKLLPVQAFSQGELSHLGQDRAEGRLLELITDPRREQFERLSSRLDTASDDLSTQLQRLVRGWVLEQRKRTTDAERQTLTARVAALRQTLSDLPEASKHALQKHGEYIAVSKLLHDLLRLNEEAAGGVVEGLRTYRNHLGRLVERPDLHVQEVLELGASVRQAIDSLDEISDRVVAIQTRVATRGNDIERGWAIKRAEHDDAYVAALAAMKGQRELAEQLQVLEARLVELGDQLSAIDEEYSVNRDAQRLLDAAIEEHRAVQLDKRELTLVLAQTVERLSGGLAVATVLQEPDFSAVGASLAALFAGTLVREVRLNELVDQVEAAHNPFEKWWELVREIVRILEWNVKGLNEGQPRPTVPVLDAIVDRGGLDRFCERITAERVIEAMKTELPPRLRVVQRRNGREIEFSRASQGERAATILTILMNQEGGPLLIDQPEEDLDNRIINDIVAGTRKVKSRRQLIFATHSANLVVNGDAELVVELDTGVISTQGAIDHQNVRDAITATMEGGREAFELRRRKYNF